MSDPQRESQFDKWDLGWPSARLWGRLVALIPALVGGVTVEKGASVCHSAVHPRRQRDGLSES